MVPICSVLPLTSCTRYLSPPPVGLLLYIRPGEGGAAPLLCLPLCCLSHRAAVAARTGEGRRLPARGCGPARLLRSARPHSAAVRLGPRYMSLSWRKSCCKPGTSVHIRGMRHEFETKLTRDCKHLSFCLKHYKEEVKVRKVNFTSNYY